MGKRKQYTEKFRKDAVRLLQSRGTRTVEEVASSLGVSPSMLHRWEKKYGPSVDNSTSQDEREEVERLRRRLREVEQENAFLKKCAALFAKEVK